MKKIFLITALCLGFAYANGLSLVNKGKVLLKGNNESCSIKMLKSGEIINSNCHHLINSKHINILCTKRKSICKTLGEVKQFLYGKNAYKALGNIINMPYYGARKKILKAGYKVKANPNPPQFGQAKKLYNRGYKEIDDCASDMIMPCRFEFYSPKGQILIVITHTEDDFVFITDWYEE